MQIYLNILLLICCCNINSIKAAAATGEQQYPKAKTHELDPVWYLNKFGYLKHNSSIASKTSEKLIMLKDKKSFLNNNKYDDEFRNAIAKFQKFANLNVTGVLDEKTLATMNLPRCGHPDLVDTTNQGSQLKVSFRKKRYALQGSKWLKHHIRYKITKYPILNSLTREQIDAEIARAFELWGTVSELKFEQIRDRNSRFSMFFGNQNEPADIEIKFETGYHGDSEPFDGPGYILGHAYFPQFGGSTHFDAEELWTKRSPEGVNLYQVAVHEFGHALGLEHSDNYDAIMAPFFRGYSEDFVLNPDDITAIQYLYGKNPHQTNTDTDRNNYNRDWNNNHVDPTYPVYKQDVPLATPAPPIFTNTNPPPASLCSDGRFDAITLLQDGCTYVFKGPYVYKFDPNFSLDPSYPKLMRSLFGRWETLTWVSVPDNLDTVLFVPESGKTYFFKDEFYWRTTFYELDPGYPKLILDNFKGLDSAHGFYGKLDASFLWSGNGRVYFIAEDKYWRYDLSRMEVEYGYPKSLSLWRGLPMRITDAVLWTNGATYFFNDGYYYRFNDLAFKVEDASPSYPRAVVDAWFGCRNRLGNLILNENNETLSLKLPKSSKLEQFEVEIAENNNNNNKDIVVNLQADDDRLDEGTLDRDKEISLNSNNRLLGKLLQKSSSVSNKSNNDKLNLLLFLSFLLYSLFKMM